MLLVALVAVHMQQIYNWYEIVSTSGYSYSGPNNHNLLFFYEKKTVNNVAELPVALSMLLLTLCWESKLPADNGSI